MEIRFIITEKRGQFTFSIEAQSMHLELDKSEKLKQKIDILEDALKKMKAIEDGESVPSKNSHITEVAVIELKLDKKTPEEVLSLIALELYKNPHRRRFFGQFSGVLKSEPILCSPETYQKQNGDSPQ